MPHPHCLRPRAILALPFAAIACLLGGCEPVAPGMVECQHAAEQLTGHKLLSAPTGLKNLSAPQRLAFQKVVRRCLVSPFDRQYLRCLEDTPADRRCVAEYRRRVQLARSTLRADESN